MYEKPWYMPPSSTEDAPNLCPICLQINFSWLLANDFNRARYAHWKSTPSAYDEPRPIKIPWVDEQAEYIFPELSLGFLFEILEKRERCSFCHLVSFTIAANYGVDLETLLAQNFGNFPSYFVFCTLSSRRKDFVQNESYDLVVDLTNIQRNFLSFKQINLQRIRDDICVPFEGRSVAPVIDFSAIGKWLAQYDLSPTSSSADCKVVPGFRVIDVQNKNVIPTDGPKGCRYLTLSYVWGGPQQFQNVRNIEGKLQETGALSEHQLPETIRDAIDFTAAIGVRYLWVDSLCIVQDDGDAKMVQIMAMDQIYSGSVMTIVASDGTSCHSGLPGVRETPGRWKQQVANVRGIKLANKQVSASKGQDRIWATRGWTFQEHALSRRCIHFSLDGLEFESEDGITHEDIHPLPHTARTTPDPIGVPIAGSIPGINQLSNIQLYALSIPPHSSRSLTFETDALNAFQGVLNIHQHRFRRDFLYGMPSSELEFAMLWQPGSHIQRRVHHDIRRNIFPSWCWVAWKGAMMWPVLGANRFSRITWVDAIDTTSEFTSEDWRGAGTAQLGDWKTVQDRGAEMATWYYQEANPTARFAHPVSSDVPAAMKQRRFLKPDSHVLTFYALSAQIKAVPGTRSLEHPHDPNAVSPPGVHSHTLQDCFNRFCGIVYLHPQDLTTFDTSVLECIAISRTAYGPNNASLDDPPSDDADVVSIRDGYAERQQLRMKSEDRSASSYFDVYEFELKWQAYDVLVVLGTGGGVRQRVGTGICLVEAFWDARSGRERIALE